jgi:hypothetical protein
MLGLSLMACLVACRADDVVRADDAMFAHRPRVALSPSALASPSTMVAIGPTPPSTGEKRNLQSECVPGERRACRIAPPVPGGTLWMTCKPRLVGGYGFDASDCSTPLVVVLDDAPVEFTAAPGAFSIGGAPRTEWVAARTPWLALDVDGSGCIEGEGELFGADATTTNGFEKLARFDDDGDGRITAKDVVFDRLVLWRDGDQDRRCAAGEIASLASVGVVSIDLRASTPSITPFGSHEGERASVAFVREDGVMRRGRVVDVYLAPLP